jgi:hypothetical protein
MKTVADISITSRFLQARGPGTPIVITATVSPALGNLRDGDSVQATLSPGALDTGNYASTAGAITAVSATVTINGSAGALTDVVRYDDVVSVSVTVSDAAGTMRDFAAGTRTVAGIAPTITSSDSLNGRTLTVSVDDTTGIPAPVTVLTALTLDGVDVAADITGADPWIYETPSSASDQTVAWTLTTTNAEGSDTAVGAEIVAADLFAPVSQTAPVITGTPAPGNTVTITRGTYSGTPAATLTGTLTLDGLDVTAELSGLDYQIPASAVPGVLLSYSETADNGIAPDAQQAVSVTVVAAETALLDTYPGAVGAWSLRKLSSSTTHVVRVRRDSDNAESNFTADDVSDGTLETWVGAGDGFVVTLFDQSGESLDVTQSVASAQPMIVNGGSIVLENGKPAMDFSGSRYLQAGAGNSLNFSGVWLDMFFVNSEADPASNDRVLTDDSGDAGFIVIRPNFAYPLLADDGDGFKTIVQNVVYTGQALINLAFDETSGDGEWFVDGSSVDTFTLSPWNGSIGTSASGIFTLGASTTGGNAWLGTQQELVVFAADKSADRAAIETEIAGYYGITLA